MKYLFFLITLPLLTGCNTGDPANYKDLALLDKSELILNDRKDHTYYYDTITTDEYQLKLGVNKLRGSNAELVISMELSDGAHYVSPNAKRNFSGKFTLTLPDSEELSIVDSMEEVPPSVEEYDEHPFVDGLVNWVRQDTKYFQKVKLNTDQDFYLLGELQFVIEPKCTLEKVRLSIRQVGGYLKFTEQPKGC